MSILKKLREHAAMASGNFASMFRDVVIPPLPAAAARLVTEINKPEPETDRLLEVISAEPSLSAKVLSTANSALYALPNRVTSVSHAVPLLGTKTIRSITLSYMMRDHLPRPDGDLFDHQAFWTDSVIRAQLARTLAKRCVPGMAEEAFTAMLLSDVALPVLLCSWDKYYAPIINRWRTSPQRLSDIERSDFGWDHAQASAWILKSWGFPEEMVCLVGSHSLSLTEIAEVGLNDSIAVPIASAALLPSVLKPNPNHAREFVETVSESSALAHSDVEDLIIGVCESFEQVRTQFGLENRAVTETLVGLVTIATSPAVEDGP